MSWKSRVAYILKIRNTSNCSSKTERYEPLDVRM